MPDDNGPTERGEDGLEFSRRSILKTAAATTAGAALFSGTASASDDRAFFEIDCFDDKIRVTLNRVRDYDTGDVLDPTELEDLRVFLATKDNADTGNDGSIGRNPDILPCFGIGTGTCGSPIAFPESTEYVGDTVVFTFDRSEAGLDSVPVGTSVVFAGIYDNPENPSRDPASLKGFAPFDPGTCDCIECSEDGAATGVSKLTLRNDSDETFDLVEVYNDKDAKDGTPLTFGPVTPGETFTVDFGTEFNKEISVYTDGEENRRIKAECKDALGPGVKQGDFLIVSGEDADGVPLCSPDCVKCGDGGDADGVSELTFQNVTDGDLSDVAVYKKDKQDELLLDVEELVGGNLKEGDTFTLSPSEDDDKIEKDISIWVGSTKRAEFHTSCSQLIGPGLERGGFEIVAGRDKDGRALCDLEEETDDGGSGGGGGGGDCVECGIGDNDAEDIVSIEFGNYTGETLTDVALYEKDKKDPDKEIRSDITLGPGESVTLEDDEIEKDISIWVGESRNAQFHTSCSQLLCVGLQDGSFEIFDAQDKDGNTLCVCP